MAGHTPGPWEARERGYVYAKVGGDPNWCVGKAYNAPDGSGTHVGSAMEANARLIAAAPDLFKACQWALPLLKTIFEQKDFSKAMAQLGMTSEPNLSDGLAAIARATGEQE